MWFSRLPSTRHDDIEATLAREGAPRFERVYKTMLSGGFEVEIKMSTYCGRRSNTSTITQRNGRWVLFDVEAVADKIIDRELCPLVEAVVARVLALDKAFMAMRPDSFVDEDGATWRRE